MPVRLWRPHPEIVPTWLDRAGHLVAVALAVLVTVTLAVLQWFVAVLLWKDYYETDLAQEGIVSGGDAYSMAMAPALWVTLALVAAEVTAVVLVLRWADRRRRERDDALAFQGHPQGS